MGDAAQIAARPIAPSEAGMRAAALCEHSRSNFCVGAHYLVQTHIRLPQRGIARQARTGHTRVQ